jgi:ATP-dependent DNA helicase RecG
VHPAPRHGLSARAEQRPVTALSGVGDALAVRLAALGVRQVQDLLFVLPLRYEDRTRVAPIGSLAHGMHAIVEGEVQLTEVIFRRRRQLVSRIADGSGFLTLRFFHFSAAQQAGLARGTRVRCYGQVRRGPIGLEIVHPEYRRSAGELPPLEDTLTPVYPATEGVTQGRLRQLIGAALRELETANVREWLPDSILETLRLPTLAEALQYVHRPPRDARLDELEAGGHPAQRRLAFEELLTHQLVLRQLKAQARTESAWPLPDRERLAQRFLASLPFQPTGAQARVIAAIEADLALARPMVRLVQGDVGCGKTVVAAAAAARAIGSGRQAALMAPTELLAEQHFRSFDAWFRPLGVTVALVSGSQPARSRRSALEAIANGDVALAIGTHALFQQSIAFRDLALVVVDEQHRFGVQQRMQLRQKGVSEGRHPHQLIMTATPIPRTLAMAAYADLDVSVIDELPPGRTPVRTVVLPDTRRDEVVARIDAACRAGRQAYWVCPLIDESEELDTQAAEETFAALQAALPGLAIGLVHGRMPPKKKDAVMLAFKSGGLQLLVATTVIEVGVDVPNASLMVVENAERMGLAQLHQLRGRVGRGTEESSCVLLYRAPLGPLARDRLHAIRDSNDGFRIAERDLELRGPGELLGTRQTGLARMRVADLARDAQLLPLVHRAAEVMLAAHADRIAPLATRWIGADERYGRVG